MKLKPSCQVGRSVRSWVKNNGECVYWARGFKSRECAEEYQADFIETLLDPKEVIGFRDSAGFGPRKHMAIDSMEYERTAADMNRISKAGRRTL